MNKVIGNFKQKKAIILAFLVPLMFSGSPAQAVNRPENIGEVTQQHLPIISAKKLILLRFKFICLTIK